MWNQDNAAFGMLLSVYVIYQNFLDLHNEIITSRIFSEKWRNVKLLQIKKSFVYVSFSFPVLLLKFVIGYLFDLGPHPDHKSHPALPLDGQGWAEFSRRFGRDIWWEGALWWHSSEASQGVITFRGNKTCRWVNCHICHAAELHRNSCGYDGMELFAHHVGLMFAHWKSFVTYTTYALEPFYISASL